MKRRLLIVLSALTLVGSGCAARGERPVALDVGSTPAMAPNPGLDDGTTADIGAATPTGEDVAGAATGSTTGAGAGAAAGTSRSGGATGAKGPAAGVAPGRKAPEATSRNAGAAAPATGPASAPAAAATTPTSGEILVGGIFPLSGPLSLIGKPGSQAASAVFRSVNDAGGINGRKIKFIFYDDKAEPDRTLAAARRLVEQDKVLLLGPSLTVYSPNLVPYIDQAQIPFVGYEGLLPGAFHSPYIIGTMASLRVMSHGDINTWLDRSAAAGTPVKRIGIVYEDVPPARTHNEDIEKYICPVRGCEIVRKEPVTITTNDFASVLTKMRLDNVDGVWINVSPPIATKALLTARSMNYRPPAGYVGHQGVYGHPVVVESCGSFCNGTLGGSTLLPAETNAPPIQEMRRLVKKYYSDWDDDVLYGVVPYVGSLALVDILKATLARGELTRASLLATAATMTNWDAHGFTAAPISLAAPQGESFNPFCYIVEMKDGKWVPVGDPVDVTKLKSWPYGPKR